MVRNITNPSLITIGIFLLSLIACEKSINGLKVTNNLLPNGSFELNNKPTLYGWRFGNKRAAELVNQAVPHGGNWALKLTSDWAPTTAFVYTSIPNINSGDILKLSAYVRGMGRFHGMGIIRLAVGQNINSYNMKEASSSDTVWTQISVTDTVNMGMNDTLWVILSSPITEVIPFQQLFDLVKLEKVVK
ncbi:MAG TPA: hypothetical protein ENK44_12970 [Caldithrix abyssi]|uniref:CBM-cenC domain-containing protein n=1 Tax=Caldithrix abyssi TaxID=187145 RepID=A0A7V4WVQ8_CALAY|nr:hypothetical protein [Caldithrix abyssi]